MRLLGNIISFLGFTLMLGASLNLYLLHQNGYLNQLISGDLATSIFYFFLPFVIILLILFSFNLRERASANLILASSLLIIGYAFLYKLCPLIGTPILTEHQLLLALSNLIPFTGGFISLVFSRL